MAADKVGGVAGGVLADGGCVLVGAVMAGAVMLGCLPILGNCNGKEVEQAVNAKLVAKSQARLVRWAPKEDAVVGRVASKEKHCVIS